VGGGPGPRFGIDDARRLGILALAQWFDLRAVANRGRLLRTGRRRFCAGPRLPRAWWRRADSDGHGRDFERLEKTRLAIRTQEMRGNPPAAAWSLRLLRFSNGAEAVRIFRCGTSRGCPRLRSNPGPRPPTTIPTSGSPRGLLASLWNALGGATSALELGDDLGWSPTPDDRVLVTRVKLAIPFHQFRDRLLESSSLCRPLLLLRTLFEKFGCGFGDALISVAGGLTERPVRIRCASSWLVRLVAMPSY